MGWEVAVFFTFYGLDILHQKKNSKLKVAPLANPAAPVALPNMVGALPGMTLMATKMMEGWMRKAKMPPLPEFIEMAQNLGVKLYACSTTMGVMGIEEKDLIDNCEIAGAAAFLDFAADSSVQMFV